MKEGGHSSPFTNTWPTIFRRSTSDTFTNVLTQLFKLFEFALACKIDIISWQENNVRNEPPSRAKAPRLQVVNMSWWIWDLTDVRFASHWDQCTLHCIDSGSQLFLSLRCLRFHLYLMSHLYVFISHITWLWFTKSYKTRNNGWSNVTGISS